MIERLSFNIIILYGWVIVIIYYYHIIWSSDLVGVIE